MFARHPFLTVIGLLTFLLLLGCSIFLITFDLNSYREDLQSSLSEALSRPVSIGEAKLSWHFGPAFDFTRLEISGQDQEPPLLTVENLYLKPKILPMLVGRLNFLQIVLDSPRLNLGFTGETSIHPNLFHTVLTTVEVDSIVIRDGHFTFQDRSLQAAPFQLDLQQVEVKASHLFSENRGYLRLDAEVVQGDRTARVKVGGRLFLPEEKRHWSRGHCDLELDVRGLEPGPLAARYGSNLGIEEARGLMDVRLTIAGSPAEGLGIAAELLGKNLALQLPGLYSSPLAIDRWTFAGRWTVAADVHNFDDLSLQADAINLNGRFTFQRTPGEPWLEGSLHTQDLPLQEIWRLMPDHLQGFMDKSWSERFPTGYVRMARARFAGPLSRFRQLGPELPLQQADIVVSDCRVVLGQGQSIERLNSKLSLEGETLTVSEGTGFLLDSPLQFSGRVEKPFAADAASTFGIAWILPAGRIGELLPEEEKVFLSGQGPIPVFLTMNGQGKVFETRLRADLDAASLFGRSFFHKTTGLPGRLEMEAVISPERLRIAKGQVQISSEILEFSGERLLLENSKPLPFSKQPFQLTCRLPGADLSKILTLFPSMEQYRLRGLVAGTCSLTGTGFDIGQARGELTARDFGLRFQDVLAGDLHGFSGQIQLFKDRMEWTAKGRLGEYPVSINGQVGNWSSPLTELVISAKKLKASDLFFPSPKAVLHDLRGRLVFSKEEVFFDRIRTSLPKSPNVHIEGRLPFASVPTLNLDITADQADIDEVVALWEGPASGETASSSAQEMKVVVNARVAKGVYGPLRFQNAAGTVTSTAGELRIDPLKFNLDQGRCQGTIVLDEAENGGSLLKISGEGENVEAEDLQNIIFDERNRLLKGSLSGKFFLEGLAGDRFLETSSGTFGITINEGVLYRFAFLSKVFSLLNVGQILTLNLPDMARKGMPFDKLEGTFSLDRGKLTTEDLFITSNAMNMSLVGTADLVEQKLDLKVGVKPFRTVDNILTHIPIAGWLLTGEEKALITAHFEITGNSDDPDVQAIPVTSLSSQVLGIFKRILGLPEKAITDPAGLITGREKVPEGAP
ncbi:MAG: AsmA-like C-terminal domain-containing protein [Syntrophotaleaceae bacterium]